MKHVLSITFEDGTINVEFDGENLGVLKDIHNSKNSYLTMIRSKKTVEALRGKKELFDSLEETGFEIRFAKEIMEETNSLSVEGVS